MKFALIAGSLRKGSFNKGLLRAAQELAKGHFKDVEVEIIEIGNLPFVNTDLEVDNQYPEPVAAFRSKVQKATSILFACPEYNGSITPVLKNAVDWGSRSPNVWGDKAAAVISAGGGFGGARACAHLRAVGSLPYVDLHFINKPDLNVRAFEPPSKFEKNGDLIDSGTREALKSVVEALRLWTIQMQHR